MAVNLYYDHSWSKGEWSFLQGVSLNRFGNLKMGETTLSWLCKLGKEAHIVDNNEQLKTAYDQVDFIQKMRLDASEYLSFKMNLQVSRRPI